MQRRGWERQGGGTQGKVGRGNKWKGWGMQRRGWVEVKGRGIHQNGWGMQRKRMERKEGEEVLGGQRGREGAPSRRGGIQKERTERKGQGRGTQRKGRGAGVRRNKGKRARRGKKKKKLQDLSGRGSSNRREKVFQRQNLGHITRCKRQEWKDTQESQMTES